MGLNCLSEFPPCPNRQGCAVVGPSSHILFTESLEQPPQDAEMPFPHSQVDGRETCLRFGQDLYPCIKKNITGRCVTEGYGAMKGSETPVVLSGRKNPPFQENLDDGIESAL